MSRLVTTLLAYGLFACFGARGQFVNLPDTNFRNALIVKFPSCFNAAKQLDTSCSQVIGANNLDVSGANIHDLTGIRYFKNLAQLNCSSNQLTALPALPNLLNAFYCGYNQLTALASLPTGLNYFSCNDNQLTALPALPSGLITLTCSNNHLQQLPALPSNLSTLDCEGNQLTSLPTLPINMAQVRCGRNQLSALPTLPQSLPYLDCTNNNLASLPTLPSNITNLYAERNHLTALPALPATLQLLSAWKNNLTSLPDLPASLTALYVDSNQLTHLPGLPSSLQHMNVSANTALQCLPFLPPSLVEVIYSSTAIHCIPDRPVGCAFVPNPLPLCNKTNNVYQCQAFPQIHGVVYNDNNSNGIFDNGDVLRENIKVQLTNSITKSSFTNSNGEFYFVADTIGPYSVSIYNPPFFTGNPASVVHTFSNYDTLVNDAFALKPNTTKDSLAIHLTASGNKARPGARFAYNIKCFNVGTTVLFPTVYVKYDNTRLRYDSSSNAAVVHTGSDSLMLYVPNMLQGQSKTFTAYFTVRTTAAIGDTIRTTARAMASSAYSFDSAKTAVHTSFDPNNKEATPVLTPTQVASGGYIDYVIHFQNTGTDTAFNVVLADTLSNLLQTNVLQMLATSHLCRTTLTNGIIYFEFLNVNLPDSNVNQIASTGFVRFRIRPNATVAIGDTIPNKASIYFDYNPPVVTNTCRTLISGNAIPVKLVYYLAHLTSNKQVLNEWTVANEVNTERYNVQRSSNGEAFVTVGSVRASSGQWAAGNKQYHFTDDVSNAFSAVNSQVTTHSLYYRLEMVDYDGRKAYSGVQKVELKPTGFSIYPNPAHNAVTVKGDAIANVTITDYAGRILLQQGVANRSILTVSVGSLQNGVYVMKLETTSGEVKAEKLIKE